MPCAAGRPAAALCMCSPYIARTLPHLFPSVYKAKHGPEVYTSYLKARRDRRRRKCAKKLAKEAYDGADEHGVGSAAMTDGGCDGSSER
jgi:hypothetical protein